MWKSPLYTLACRMSVVLQTIKSWGIYYPIIDLSYTFPVLKSNLGQNLGQRQFVSFETITLKPFRRRNKGLYVCSPLTNCQSPFLLFGFLLVDLVGIFSILSVLWIKTICCKEKWGKHYIYILTKQFQNQMRLISPSFTCIPWSCIYV